MSWTKEVMLENTVKLLKSERTIFIIQYGSSLYGEYFNDIDLFLIEEGQREVEEIIIGNLDIARMGINNFGGYIDKKDPTLATEPILTGKLIFGNEEEFNKLKRRLMEGSADINYLLRASLAEHLKAIQFVEYQRLKESLGSLSFAFSYRLFAEWYYVRKGKPIDWKSLLFNINKETEELWEKLSETIRIGKLDKEKIKEETVLQLITQWEDILLTNRRLL
jgi:hypothetical protein